MLSLAAPKGLKIILLSVLLFFMMSSHSFGEDPGPKKEIGFDEKIGESIPLDLRFLDEHGQTVSLKQLFDKPVLFCLVYYRCPGLCSPLLKGVADVVDHMDLVPDKDFKIVTISFDPKETYTTAAEKKNNYLEAMQKKIPAGSWHFMTGDSITIAKITDAVGFRYMPQGQDYMHAAAIMVLSKDGKIARYLYGIDFNPVDLKMAVFEASEGRTGPSIATLMKLCYSYDPDNKKYVLNITRIAGSGIMLLLGLFIVVVLIKKKKNINPDNNQEGNLK